MRIAISLTEACNLACSYCYFRDRPCAKSMSPETLSKLLEFFFKETLKRNEKRLNISFFGGEPLLCLNLIKKAVSIANQFSKKLDIAVQYLLCTNGTLFTPEIISFIKEENIGIALSLDGEAKTHDLHRYTQTRESSFHLIEPYFAELVKMDTTIFKVITPQTLENLTADIEFIVKLGFPKIALGTDFSSSWSDKDYFHLKKNYESLLGFYKRWILSKNALYLNLVSDRLHLFLRNAKLADDICAASCSSFGVSSQGDIFPCVRFITTDKKSPYLLGNVFTEINDTICRDFAKSTTKVLAKCKKCAYRNQCAMHNCSCISYSTTGKAHGFSPHVCRHEKILLPLIEKMFIQSEDFRG